MNENPYNELNPAAVKATIRLQKHIDAMHEIRDKINHSLAKVSADNLTLALTQKKNLSLLQKKYDELSGELTPKLQTLTKNDAIDNDSLMSLIELLESEFNYILTIENIIETTRELKNNPNIPPEHREGLIDGLTKFYDGLRMELAMADAK